MRPRSCSACATAATCAKVVGRPRVRGHESTQLVRRADTLSKCGWSPFDGETFRSRIDATWVNGHLAWHDGKLDDSQLGMRLEIGRGRE
jgi:hypothetical protein